jgi:hypothetical protein
MVDGLGLHAAEIKLMKEKKKKYRFLLHSGPLCPPK